MPRSRGPAVRLATVVHIGPGLALRGLPRPADDPTIPRPMALAHVHYWSAPLQKQCGLFLALPEREGPPPPVVYLLHGLSDDYTIWQRRTSVERYAEALGLAVVMPDGGRSFYVDAIDGSGDWEKHILATVGFIERGFRVRADRAGRGIGGLSMGGYGSLKIALRHPELFCAATPHSGVLDIAEWAENPDRAKLLRRVLGPKPPASEDCFRLVAALRRKGAVIPRLRIDCGTEDFLIEHNRRFHRHLTKLGVEHEYAEHPGGHDWAYWDRHVQAALAFHQRAFADATKPAKRKASA